MDLIVFSVSQYETKVDHRGRFDSMLCVQPSTQYETKVDLRVLLPDRNTATVKVSKNSTTADVYQVEFTLLLSKFVL